MVPDKGSRLLTFILISRPPSTTSVGEVVSSKCTNLEFQTAARTRNKSGAMRISVLTGIVEATRGLGMQAS